jgi:tRNA pseudouridine38-40 synthase
MRTLKLTLAYDGAAYCGWQRQPGAPTVQGAIEDALARITGARPLTVGAGRTDAGVHALGQVASFETHSPLETAVIGRALNGVLPDDIVVLGVAEAPAGFSARRDARSKRYRYVLHDGPLPDVFRRRYCWHDRRRLDAAAMHEAAQALVGEHDFASFQSAGSPRRSTVRRVLELTVRRREPPDEHFVDVEIEADGFLYNMVRAIVGTLVEVARGRRDADWPTQVLAARDRSAAGTTAPPQGLFLVRVTFQNGELARDD